MGITKRAQYKVFNGTDFDVINFESEADNQGIYRQALINGNFDVWQRGTVFNFAANVNPVSPYTADRWYITKVWGDVLSVTRQPFDVGQTAVPNNPRFFLRATYGSGTGKSVNIVQKIEGLPFSGMPITISFWAKSNVPNSLNIMCEQQYSSSSEDGWQTKSITTSSTWTKYSASFILPSSYSKSPDWNVCNTSILLQCGFTNTGDYVDIAQVQVNFGTTPLPFFIKSFADEVRACQRYYESSYSLLYAPGVALANGFHTTMCSGTYDFMCPTISFKVSKRIKPTLTVYNPNTGVLGSFRDNTTYTDVTGMTLNANENSPDKAYFYVGAGGLSSGHIYSWHWTADAEL